VVTALRSCATRSSQFRCGTGWLYSARLIESVVGERYVTIIPKALYGSEGANCAIAVILHRVLCTG
jgi:hypothetical protein